MLQNGVLQITTGKLVAASLLPSSVLLVSGIIIWRIWHNKQARLQTETDELNNELRQIKQQMSGLQIAKKKANSNDANSATETSPSSKHEKKSNKRGLFEHLIEENIQLRQQA